MNDFIDNLMGRSDKHVAMLLFMSLFLLGIAFFQTLILRNIYGWKYKPKWLLFVLEPVVLFLLWSIESDYSMYFFIFSFLLTFALLLIAIFVAPLVSRLIEAKTMSRKTGKKFTGFTVGKVVVRYVGGIVGLLAVLTIAQASFPLTLLFMFILLPLSLLKYPGGDRRFIHLQATLPTSPIRSVAMGLAEVEGNTVMREPLYSPINHVACIAYKYEIEEVGTDREGHSTYTTIHTENRCNAFSLQDETGVLDVTPDRLNLLLLPVHFQFTRNGKRYTQQLLLPGEKVLLVGMADTKEGKTVFRYEEVKGVYALMASHSLNSYNKAKPLINRFLLYTSIFGIIVSLILLCQIAYQDGELHISLPFGNTTISNNY